MTRQYIGARYVPKFSDINGGVWDNTYTYEPLEIVQYGLDFYTSKKRVPTGVAITNSDYWALTGQYNANIAQLRVDVDAINNDLPKKEYSIKNRKFLVIGDSYTSSLSNKLITALISSLGSPQYLRVAGDGYGFVGKAAGYEWETLLSSTTIADPDSYTDVIIIGGTNDRNQTKADILDAMASLDTYLKANFTGINNIYCGMIGALVNDASSFSLMGRTYHTYVEGSIANGWRYLTNIECVALNPDYWDIGDIMHPTQAGVSEIGRQVAQAVMTGSALVNFSKTITGTVDNDSPYAPGTSATVRFSVVNGIARIYTGTFDGNSDGTLSNFTVFSMPSMVQLPISQVYRSTVPVFHAATLPYGCRISVFSDKIQLQFFGSPALTGERVVVQPQDFTIGHPYSK